MGMTVTEPPIDIESSEVEVTTDEATELLQDLSECLVDPRDMQIVIPQRKRLLPIHNSVRQLSELFHYWLILVCGVTENDIEFESEGAKSIPAIHIIQIHC